MTDQDPGATQPMSLPREAREGISRVWLEILKEKHPSVGWVLASDGLEQEQHVPTTDESLVAAA
jgi:hypothetical protein